jgi:hypothetical protein
MDRRQFSVEAARLLLGGAAIAISGCGSDSSPTASSPLTDVEGRVSSNHGHTAVISAAQLGEGGGLELSIQGEASHAHTLSLTADEVRSVGTGLRVAKESSGGRHTHSVTFNG